MIESCSPNHLVLLRNLDSEEKFYLTVRFYVHNSWRDETPTGSVVGISAAIIIRGT